MKEKDQDDIIDYEEFQEGEPDPDDDASEEDEEYHGPTELNFETDETYKGDPEWDPSQR